MSNTNNALMEILVERFPWAKPERLQQVLELLESKTGDAGQEPEFTMEMLNDAIEVGHQIAQILTQRD